MIKKILIVRNDKLGDFMLSLPCFYMLKKNLPTVNLYALVPEYTKSIAAKYPYIDEVIIDDGSIFKLANSLKKYKFDAVIVLFSTIRIALATLIANIPYRIAPATKIAQIFYKNTIIQRRSKSEKPEFEYNLDMIRYFLKNNYDDVLPPFWILASDKYKLSLSSRYDLNNKKLIFIHPGHGGSANNLSIAQYALLANNLIIKKNNLFFVITAGEGEENQALKLLNMINSNNKMILKRLTLFELLNYINIADLFISGSTGPLHMAGVLNKKTVGFYPNLISSTSLRWQTMNAINKSLSFSPDNNDFDYMLKIDIKKCTSKIYNTFLK